jgi:hypothetical protein
LAELNDLIAAADLLDDDRVITGRPIIIGAAFALEAPARLRTSRTTTRGKRVS